jgi:AAA domain-containing protein/primase-like protein
MSYTNIPALLRRITRWLVHTTDKIPHYADGGRRQGRLDSPADIARLADFKAAVAALAGSSYAGVGFALGDGIGGIDLDNCIDDSGVVAQWAHAIVKALDSYTEVSPSGHGLHIIVQYPKEKEWRALGSNGSGVEFYPAKRYFTMTGKAVHKPANLAVLTPERYAFLVERHEPGRGDNVVQLPARPAPSLWQYQKLDALQMLPFIPHDLPRAEWLAIGMALHHASGGAEDAYEMWHAWSAGAANYNAKDWPSQWLSFKEHEKPVTFSSLVAKAREHGHGKSAAQPERAIPGGLPKEFALDDLDTMVIPETQWIVDGIIAPGLTLLTAPPKQGKSYLALQVCICVGAGVAVLGATTRAVRTTYFDLEEWHRLLKDRVDAIKTGHGLTGKKMPVFIKLESGVGDKFLADLQSEYDKGSRLVVVDILARVRDELNEDARKNAYARDYAIIARLADFAIAHPDLALVVVHHANKGKHDNWIDKISGSAGIGGAAHTTIYLARPDMKGMGEEDREDALKYRVLHVVGKEAKEREIALEMMDAGGGWRVSSYRPHELSTTRKQKDVLVLLGTEARWWTSAEIAERLGVQRNALRRLLWRMSKKGVIESAGQGADGFRLRP